MQTFLPYISFAKSARHLDVQRLGKQRVETLQLLQAIESRDGAWANHPCTKMWMQYSGALVRYGLTMCDEWISLGYRDSCRDQILSFGLDTHQTPEWLTEAFCATHRAALLYKDYEFYSKFGWKEEPAQNYFWPNSENS